MKEILTDTRPIEFVTTHGEEGDYWRVGKRRVTKIVPYSEPGQRAYVTWLAVYTGDEISDRVNCAFVDHIRYMPQSEERRNE